jgi:hypothetical protein
MMTGTTTTLLLRLGVLGVAALLSCGSVPASAQPFSADLVTTGGDGGTGPVGKIRVFDEKVRIETAEFAGGFFLVDGTSHSAYFAQPADRIYMEARQSSRLTRLFVRVDPADPCREWQTMAKNAGVTGQGDWHCEHIGEETIGARATTVYRAGAPGDRNLVGWIDPELRFPLQIRMADGTVVEAKNIRMEAQPARLFEIPAGFRKFDPQDLIERIKQSDVWVEESK